MKKSLKSLFVIIAAMVTFAGCQKEENNAPATQSKTVEFFAESIETKTHFGDKNDQNQYPVYWDAADKVKVLLNIEQVSGTEKTLVVTPSDDFTSARFVADITDPSTAEKPVDSYTFYSVSPSSAYSGKSATDGRITMKIPAEQTPLETSVDKGAQVLYAVSETTATMPSSVNLAYHHLTAYGKFSLTNLTSKVSAVSKIQIIAPEDVYISGKWNYMVKDGSIVAHDEDVFNNIIIATSKTSDIWFACAPVDASGQDVKIVVTTDQGDLEKIVRFPKKFESGKVATFTVNMDGIEPPVQEETSKYYQKVITAPSDWSGKYLVVYENGTDAYVFNGLDAVNGYVSATISDGKITSTDNLAAVQVTIESMAGGYAVKTANGYIYGTSGDNKLNFNASTQQLNTISLESDGVLLTSNTSVLRFNATSNQMRFRYFKASSYAGQKAICLYRLVDGDSGGETPDQPDTPASPVQLIMTNITCSAQTENSLTFTWASVANASKYEVSINGRTEEVDGITYTATGLNAATQYTISVKAVGDGTNYTTSEAKTQTGTTTAAQGGNEEGGKTGYTLVETLSDIETGEYVIAVNVDGTYYAMKNAFADKITGGAITVTDKTIAESDAADYVVTITKSGNNFTIKNASSYLKYNSSTNLGTQTNAYNWTISSGTKGSFRVLSGTSGRGLVFRAKSYNQFGGYVISNISANGTEYYDVELFKKN